MRRRPRDAVLLDIDQIPRREREGVQLRARTTCGRPANRRPRGGGPRNRQSRNPREIGIGIVAPPGREVEKGLLGLPQDHRVRAHVQVGRRLIDGVRAVDHDPRASRLCRADHLEGGFAHPRRAHLGEEIEIVLEDADDLRARGVQQIAEFFHPLRQHRVEEREVAALASQQRRRDERRKRRIRLHFPGLLRVVAHVVRMRQQQGRVLR